MASNATEDERIVLAASGSQAGVERTLHDPAWLTLVTPGPRARCPMQQPKAFNIKNMEESASVQRVAELAATWFTLPLQPALARKRG